jgi:uncharacterized protein (TIGR02246 family)
MKQRITSLSVASCAAALLLVACAVDVPRRGPEQQVAAAFSTYRDAVLRTDSDAIAALFEPDASIAHNDGVPIAGRQNIRRHLDTLAGYKLIPYDVDIQSTRREDGGVVQVGDYRQVMRMPSGETVYPSGSIRLKWLRQANGAWLIESLRTVSPSL